MLNIESLPKIISINDDWYELNLHVTFKTRLCVSYKFVGGAKRAMEMKKEYNILSQVVEPDMGDTPINYTDDVYGIVDVPNIDMAWNVLSSRLNHALSNNEIKVEAE